MAHHDCHRGGHPYCASCGSGLDRQARGSSAAQETVEGRIAEVVYLAGSTKDTGMVELRVAVADGGDVLIRLAPAGVLRQLQIEPREGQTVRVNGYWVAASGGDRMIATSVTTQGRTVSLRDTSGHCRW